MAGPRARPRTHRPWSPGARNVVSQWHGSSNTRYSGWAKMIIPAIAAVRACRSLRRIPVPSGLPASPEVQPGAGMVTVSGGCSFPGHRPARSESGRDPREGPPRPTAPAFDRASARQRTALGWGVGPAPVPPGSGEPMSWNPIEESDDHGGGAEAEWQGTCSWWASSAPATAWRGAVGSFPPGPARPPRRGRRPRAGPRGATTGWRG